MPMTNRIITFFVGDSQTQLSFVCHQKPHSHHSIHGTICICSNLPYKLTMSCKGKYTVRPMNLMDVIYGKAMVKQCKFPKVTGGYSQKKWLFVAHFSLTNRQKQPCFSIFLNGTSTNSVGVLVGPLMVSFPYYFP